MITDRLFGVPVPKVVRDKLKARQELASGKVNNKDPLVYSAGEDKPDLPKSNFKYEADLSSRTPFVRMWTGIKVTGVETNEDKPDEDGDATKNIVEIAKKVYILGTNNIGELTSKRGPHSSLNLDEAGFATKQNYSIDDYAKEQAQYDVFPDEHGVYGDHNKFMKPGAGITSMTSETMGDLGQTRKTTVNFMVHNFHDFDKIYQNYFLRPGSYLYIDFGWDSLEEPLYDPRKWIEEYGEQSFDTLLYGDPKYDAKEPLGWVTANKGDADTVSGLVTDYTSKILPNGSVECSVTITSKNAALLQQKTDEQPQSSDNAQKVYNKFEKDIDSRILFEKIYGVSDEATRETLGEYVQNSTISGKNEEKLESFIQESAKATFGGDDTTMPFHISTLSGIYFNDGVAYMNWGLFEDEFLNNYFAHGTNLELINGDNKDNKIKFDSSKSWATLDASEVDDIGVVSVLYERQFDLDSTFPFLIPEQWDLTYNTLKDKSALTRVQREQSIPALNGANGSQNLKELKQASKDLLKEENDITNSIVVDDNKLRVNHFTLVNNNLDKCKITASDFAKCRIPLREVFIKTSIIKDAFKKIVNKENGGTVSDVVEEILKTISESIGGDDRPMWDWQIKGTQADNLSIVDFNYSSVLKAERETEKAQAVKNIYEGEKFADMVTFNIMGPDSIVNDFSVEFKMPSDEYSSLIAIKSMTAKDTSMRLSTTKKMATNIAFQLLLSKINQDADNANLLFENIPELGVYKPSVTAAEKKDAQEATLDYVSIYDNISKDTKKYPKSGGYWLSDFNVDKVMESYDEELAPEKKEEEAEEPEDTIIADPNGVDKQKSHKKVMTTDTHRSSEDAWNAIIAGKQVLDEDNTAMTLPLDLSLSIYGCGIIQPGDIFKVDYLPQVYLKSVYFQVFKVIQNIDASGGWSTSLESKFKLIPLRYQDKSQAEHDYDATAERRAINLEHLVKDSPELLAKLRGFQDRVSLSKTNRDLYQQKLDKDEAERLAEIDRKEKASKAAAKLKKRQLAGEATINPKDNTAILSCKNNKELKYYKSDRHTCVYHDWSRAYGEGYPNGQHFGMESPPTYSYSDDGWITDPRAKDISVYDHQNVSGIQDLLNKYSKNWKYYLWETEKCSYIKHFFTFVSAGGTKVNANRSRGGLYYMNPMYAYNDGSNWRYDGYGYGGQEAGRLGKDTGTNFLTDMTCANNKLIMFYINKTDSKCYGFWPKFTLSEQGGYGKTFKARMDESWVGWSGSTSYTHYKNF